VSFVEDNDIPQDFGSMRRRLEDGLGFIVYKYLIIDSQGVPNLDRYLLESRQFFQVNFPQANSVYPQLPGGPTSILAGGHAVLIQGLEVGTHTIDFGFRVALPRGSAIARQLASNVFVMDVSYIVDVGRQVVPP
jgi:hypothetical protein